MDELGKLKARRDRQARTVARLEWEVNALRNRGDPRASIEGLETVLSRNREALRQLSAGIDAAEPKLPHCTHGGAVRVELSTGEVAAWLCPDCDQQLPPEWSRPQIGNQDRSRRGLLAAIALLYKRKAEILMMFDYGPDLDQQIGTIDAEIARRMEQLSDADRGYMIAKSSADPRSP